MSDNNKDKPGRKTLSLDPNRPKRTVKTVEVKAMGAFVQGVTPLPESLQGTKSAAPETPAGSPSRSDLVDTSAGRYAGRDAFPQREHYRRSHQARDPQIPRYEPPVHGSGGVASRFAEESRGNIAEPDPELPPEDAGNRVEVSGNDAGEFAHLTPELDEEMLQRALDTQSGVMTIVLEEIDIEEGDNGSHLFNPFHPLNNG